MDEEQLLELRELEALETIKTIDRSRDVNSYGSIANDITEKSIIKEYKL